jgi:Flp pilus assembly protein TadG
MLASLTSSVFRVLGRCGELIRHEAGMAAVEFSLILPILVLLWFGGVELTQGLSIDRRLNNLDSSIGDLAARSKTLTWGDVDAIFDIGPGAMFPYAATGLQMRVTAVNIDGSQNGKVAWSRADGTTAYATNLAMNTLVPLTLRVANTQIIMAEVFYTYTPAIGYVITGPVALKDRMYFVPRLVTNVKLCDNAGANCLS